MALKCYLFLTGCVFATVTLLHVIRLSAAWPVLIGTVEIPALLSVLGGCATAGLSLWAFLLIGKTEGISRPHHDQ